MPKIGRVASGTRLRKRGVAELSRIHVSSVWPSYSSALAACHGASTGTSVDISLSSVTAAASSGRIAGSGGAVPVGPVSLHSTRSPSM